MHNNMFINFSEEWSEIMKQICSFCGESFFRDDRALLSEKFCPKCITQRLKASGATVYDKNNITLHCTNGGYIFVTPNN